MPQENVTSGYKFNILNEDVAEKDLFDDQTHANVSENLYNLIQSSEKGVTVGLEGSWGSGKSTVINLLRDRLSKNGNRKTLFFMFDAWAHDGDPLRRIFLESLIREIDPKNEDQYLIKTLNEITGRQKTIKVESKKSASEFAKLLSFVALTIPLGSALLGKVNYQGLRLPLTNDAGSIYWLFVLGFLFCTSPFIFLIYWWKFGEKDANGKVKWEFFKTESVENSTQDITEDGERTSIEFEKKFEEILKYTINEKAISSILLVIDNLDRVTPEHAKNIWATLQTFFQRRSKSILDQEWAKKIWFIIPFDREGFMRIWDQDNTESSLASSFVKKCFQLIAEVPAPVMSAWPEYAKQCIDLSLVGWSKTERQIVLETFQKYASRLDVSPTPRDIKVIINQIGMLGMRWGGLMSPEAICLYGLYRQEYSESNLRKKLLDAGLPNSYESQASIENLKMELSGMLFGVIKEKGVQLLLSPLIKAGIGNGDGEVIKDLLDKHGTAFWIAWQATRGEFLPSVTHTEEYKVSVINALHDGLYRESHLLSYEISKILDIWKTNGREWDFKNVDYSIPTLKLDALIKKPQEIFGWTNDKLLKKYNTLTQSLNTEEFDSGELINIVKLRNTLKENGFQSNKLSFPNLNTKNWTAWLNALSEEDISLPEIVPAKGTITAIATRISSNPNILEKTGLNELLQTISIFPKSPEWADVSTKISTWANSSERETGNEAAYQLILRIIGHCTHIDHKPLLQTLKQSNFWNIANQENIDIVKTVPILAAVIWEEELQQSPLINSKLKAYWNETKDQNKFEKVFQFLQEYKQTHVVWKLAKKANNELAIQIIKYFVQEDLYSNYQGAMYFDEYTWATDDDIESIVVNLCKFGGVANCKKSFENKPTTFDRCLFLIKKYGDSEAVKFVNQVISNLSNEQWDESFNNSNYLLQCNDVGDHKYSGAFERYFMSSLTGKKIDDWNLENFPYLESKALDAKIFQKRFTEQYFTTENDPLNNEVFKVFSVFMFENITAINNEKLMVRLCNWFDEDQWDRIEWLASITFQITDTPLEHLESRVKEKLKSSENQEELNILKKIVRCFGIVINVADENSVGIPQQSTTINPIAEV